MQLTCATLAAYTKYPRESLVNGNDSDLQRKSARKFGFFQEDKHLFREVAEEVGLIPIQKDVAWWCRHPLAFLVEAADDITYSVIDFEDGYRLGYISFVEVRDVLSQYLDSNGIEQLDKIKYEKEKVEYLRAKTINALILEFTKIFMDCHDEILSGKFDESLINKVKNPGIVKQMKTISSEKAYCARNVLEIEAAGFQVLGDLIEFFLSAANDVSKNPRLASAKSKKLLQLIPSQFLGDNREPDRDLYSRVLKITDFVSGMTDSYSVSLYKKISGISLPR